MRTMRRAVWETSDLQSCAVSIQPEALAVACEEAEDLPLISPRSRGGSVDTGAAGARGGKPGGEQVRVMEEGASLV